MFPFFSTAPIKPLRGTESLLCVSMQQGLIPDHSADTLHHGDFIGHLKLNGLLLSLYTLRILTCAPLVLLDKVECQRM